MFGDNPAVDNTSGLSYAWWTKKRDEELLINKP